MAATADTGTLRADKRGNWEAMANARDTRMVMIVDSEPAQQQFLSALVSRGGWRSVVAADTDTALAKLGTQEGMALDAVLVDQGAPGVPIPNSSPNCAAGARRCRLSSSPCATA